MPKDWKTRIEDLLTLPDNWDTYGGKRATVEAAVAATTLIELCDPSTIEMLYIYPTSESGVELEIDDDTVSLSLRFNSAGKLSIHAVCPLKHS